MNRIAAKLAIAATLIITASALSGCAVYEPGYYAQPAYGYYGYAPPPPVVVYERYPHWGGGGWGGGGGGWGHRWR